MAPLPRPPLPPLIVLLGPTAVGKTALSLALCRRFRGEIVSADSRQVYRGMDIGTAKATPAEQAQAPHHLLDIRDPDEILTVAEYQQMAYAAIAQIHARGHVPFLVGGTALYLRAVTLGLRIPEVPPDPALRAALGLHPTVPVVGYFGRLEHGKGVDVLLDAAALVHTKLPTAFLLVGDGPLRVALTERAAAARTRDRSEGRRAGARRARRSRRERREVTPC